MVVAMPVIFVLVDWRVFACLLACLLAESLVKSVEQKLYNYSEFRTPVGRTKVRKFYRTKLFLTVSLGPDLPTIEQTQTTYLSFLESVSVNYAPRINMIVEKDNL